MDVSPLMPEKSRAKMQSFRNSSGVVSMPVSLSGASKDAHASILENIADFQLTFGSSRPSIHVSTCKAMVGSQPAGIP